MAGFFLPKSSSSPSGGTSQRRSSNKTLVHFRAIVVLCVSLNFFHMAHIMLQLNPGGSEFTQQGNFPMGTSQATLHSWPPRPVPQLTEVQERHLMFGFERERGNIHDCHERKLFNQTWGESVAPYVDKYQVKQLMQHVPFLKIVPTIAMFRAENISMFTPEFLKNLPESYIVKPTHTSGGVARIVNGTYQCFKQCIYGMDSPPAPLSDPSTYELMRENMRFHLSLPYRRAQRETQYQFITKGIIFEDLLSMKNNMKEYHLWIAKGQVLFVLIRCDADGISRGAYLSSDFRMLNMTMSTLEQCPVESLVKPKTWEIMLMIARTIGEHIPDVIRLDLYSNTIDEDVYLSELTFTSTSCEHRFYPLLAETLVYGAQHSILPSNLLTPEIVETLLNHHTWVKIVGNYPHGRLFRSTVAKSYPSGSDLCNQMWNVTRDTCLKEAVEVLSFPVRCVVEDSSGEVSNYSAFGLLQTPTIMAVLDRVDWPWACGLAFLILILSIFGLGGENTKQPRRQYLWNAIYLSAAMLYKLCKPNSQGLLAPEPLYLTFIESIQAFIIVHPAKSHFVALSHLATYWFEVAAWQSRSLRSMLFWYLMYESVASFVNEYSHHLEEDNIARCVRVSFIASMKQYAINDTIRAYVMAPFLVYGYMLPKMLWIWLSWILGIVSTQ